MHVEDFSSKEKKYILWLPFKLVFTSDLMSFSPVSTVKHASQTNILTLKKLFADVQV